MSAYTISEIVVWLSLTAVLGVVLGWLLHSPVSARRTSTRRWRRGPVRERTASPSDSTGG